MLIYFFTYSVINKSIILILIITIIVVNNLISLDYLCLQSLIIALKCLTHWRILRSSCRKLTWLGFEPATTEFHSDALTDWAIRPRFQLTFRATFAQLLQFHILFNVHISFQLLHWSVATFVWSKFCTGNHISVAELTDPYGIHHWRILRSN